MRQAIEAAGILDKRDGLDDTIVSIVTEPEAAALATLMGVNGRPDIEKDDCFVVCDCGGGTVDLISYAVTKVKPMVVRESVDGEGMSRIFTLLGLHSF